MDLPTISQAPIIEPATTAPVFQLRTGFTKAGPLKPRQPTWPVSFPHKIKILAGHLVNPRGPRSLLGVNPGNCVERESNPPPFGDSTATAPQ